MDAPNWVVLQMPAGVAVEPAKVLHRAGGSAYIVVVACWPDRELFVQHVYATREAAEAVAALDALRSAPVVGRF